MKKLELGKSLLNWNVQIIRVQIIDIELYSLNCILARSVSLHTPCSQCVALKGLLVTNFFLCGRNPRYVRGNSQMITTRCETQGNSN